VSYTTRDDRAIDLPVLPGVYDVVYRRYTSSSDLFVVDHEPADPYAYGIRVLQEDLVVGSGTTTLDIDLAPERVLGGFTYAGMSLPARSTEYAGIGVWLRAKDTGSSQLLERIVFSSTWDGVGYPLVSYTTRDDRVIDLPVLPGVYDVVYRRYTSSSDLFVIDHEPADPYAYGVRYLGGCVVVP
jgi:23S rRNA U2552 (ribose-2'-O)-methylase RlmE/FtsJ